MSSQSVTAVLGASSLVGKSVIPMLTHAGHQVLAYSRVARDDSRAEGVNWRMLQGSASSVKDPQVIASWLCLAPIWVLPHYFAMIEAHGARRVVALSSTSRFTKTGSSESSDVAVAARLVDGEDQFKAWAIEKGIEWVILRPTMIYGRGQDKNLTEITRFIGRVSFFPLLDRATGLRQPIHVQDAALACMAALSAPAAANRAYNIAGHEALPYREMIERIFGALGRRPRLVRVPFPAFWLALKCLRIFPKYRHWTVAMAQRMNKDMVFDCSEAKTDLGFSPRSFRFGPEDLPR